MSEPTLGAGEVPSAPDDLQFDRAEPLNPEPTERCCRRCQNAITGSYYVVLGEDHCPSCKEAREAEPRPKPLMKDLGRATLFGIGAAVLGSAIYYAVLAISGYELGIIAIAVGWMVGTAVNRGGRGIGGWKLQTIAIALTYCSIVASYLPLIFQGASQQLETEAAVTATAKPGKPAAPAKPDAIAQAEPPTSPAGLVIAFAIVAGVALAVPFLAGFENIFGLVIIAIGLFEAWKLNKRTELQIAGPFDTAAPADAQ